MRIFHYLLLLLLCAAQTAYAQSKPVKEITYKQGQGFVAFTQKLVMPFFDREKQKTFHAGELSFALWDKLHPASQQSMMKYRKYDVEKSKQFYSHAFFDFANNQIKLQDGTVVKSDGMSANFVSYDAGRGMIIDFAPLAYRVYYSPTNEWNIRAYSILEDGRYWDKSYEDLDAEMFKIRDPAFTFALYDAAITGNFSGLKHFSLEQQLVAVDALSIAIAEYYWADKRFTLKNPPLYRHVRDAPFTRNVPFTGSVFLIQFFAQGGKQLIGKGEELWDLGKNNNSLSLQITENLGFYYNKSYYMRADQYMGELVITQALRSLYPIEFEQLEKSLNGWHADNFIDMLSLFIEMPERYDAKSRKAVQTIIMGLPQAVPAINQHLEDYVYFKTLKRMVD